MHLLIWIFALVVLGLWTLTAWGLAAVFGLDPNWVGDLKPLIEQVPFGEVLGVWVPGWESLLLALVDTTRVLLGWLGGAGVVVVWIVWAIGAALIVGTAAIGSAVVALVRRKAAPPSAAAA